MKTNKILLGISALALTAVLTPSLVSAYRGDPNVQGPNYTPERHAAITQAFTNNDYNAWLAQMQGKGVTRRINQDNFSQFAKAHQLMLEGKTDEAAAIRAELGLGQGQKNGSGTGNCQGYGKNR